MIRSLSNLMIQVGLWLGCSWLLYHSAEITFTTEGDGTQLFRDCFFYGMITNALIFFGVLYLFPRDESRWSGTFQKRVLGLFLAVTVLELVIDQLVLHQMGALPNPELSFQIRLGTMVGNLLLVGLGLFTGLVFDWFHQHRLAREVSRQQVQTELDLLKARINPHFLFNVLNGIFYLAQKNGDEETADAIARLSHMMRYMLHDVSQAQVPLAGELDYLENYVAMQRMRLAETIPIVFAVEGEPEHRTVPPMLLLPFVENAFKHGVSNANPTPITIHVRIEPERLLLKVENHIHPNTDPEGSGFGLENARRRLDLLYPNKYHLHTSERAGRYLLELTLNTSMKPDPAPKPHLNLKEANP